MIDSAEKFDVRVRSRYRYASLAILTILVVGAHLVPGLSSSMLSAELRNSVHIIGFATIAGILYSSIQISHAARVILVLIVILVLGLVSEFAQSRMEAIDVSDVLRDLSGATIFLAARLLWGWSTRIPKFVVLVRGLSLVIALSLFAPFVYWSSVFGRYVTQFPIILDFERETDYLVFEPINATVSIVDSSSIMPGFDGRVLKVDLQRHRWSGIRIDALVNDWSDYEFLSFRTAMQGDSSTRMDVHLSDGPHPGLRSQHLIGGNPIGPHATEIRLPLRGLVDIAGRPNLNKSGILEAYIIGKDRLPGAVLILDDIRLQ